MSRKILFISFILLSACGREASPIKPEKLTPRAVTNIVGDLKANVLTVTFLAPTQDLRGKPLKSNDGYRIYKVEVPAGTDPATMKPKDFLLFQTLPDATLKKLEGKKETLKKEGKSINRVKLEDSERVVVFSDSTLTKGKTYLYKIASFNEYDIDGAILQIIKAVTNNAIGEVSFLENTQVKEDFEDTVAAEPQQYAN